MVDVPSSAPAAAQTYYYYTKEGRRVPGVSKEMTATEAATLNERLKNSLIESRWKTEAEVAGSGQKVRVYNFRR